MFWIVLFLFLMTILTFHSNHFIFMVHFLLIETWKTIIKQIKNTIPLSYASIQAHYRCSNNCEQSPKLIVPIFIEKNQLSYDHLLSLFLIQVISDLFLFFIFWISGRQLVWKGMNNLYTSKDVLLRTHWTVSSGDVWLPSSCCHFSTLIWYFFQVYIS